LCQRCGAGKGRSDAYDDDFFHVREFETEDE
jgi:hypothetical protein